MTRASTPSFVTEIPLQAGSYERSILGKRFYAAKQQYNALLGEALKRLRRIRADVSYEKARTLYKQEGKKRAATALFSALARAYSYSTYDLHSLLQAME